jgi:hypothetical protein
MSNGTQLWENQAQMNADREEVFCSLRAFRCPQRAFPLLSPFIGVHRRPKTTLTKSELLRPSLCGSIADLEKNVETCRYFVPMSPIRRRLLEHRLIRQQQ